MSLREPNRPVSALLGFNRREAVIRSQTSAPGDQETEVLVSWPLDCDVPDLQWNMPM